MTIFEPPLSKYLPLLSLKIKGYAHVFDIMDKHDGWLRYPDSVLNHLEAVGAKHWADLYFREGIESCPNGNKDQLIEPRKPDIKAPGIDLSPEAASELIFQQIKSVEENIKAFNENSGDSYYAKFDCEQIDVESLSDDERKEQCDFWVSFHFTFFNDLSLAVHGEPITSLIQRAVELEDDDALVKAVQIDRSLLLFFHERLWRRAMKGNGNFYESLGYRLKNPPRRGANRHPLLWLLFNDLFSLGFLRGSITSKKILDTYQEIIPDHPKYSIDDELIVQRQRRNFMKMYRQRK